MRVFVVTSDKYLWAVRPFAHLFNSFWSDKQEVVIIGFKRPDFGMPSNFSFYSVGPENYPQSKWSNSLIEALSYLRDQYFVLMLEDYFICRQVDTQAIEELGIYMTNERTILRADLTTDRLHAKGDARDARDIGSHKHYDIIETPHGTPYQMSFQAGIWNRELLLQLLEPGKSPWEVETNTQPPAGMRVIGTRQWPLRYINAIWKGKLDMQEVARIPDGYRQRVMQWIPPELERR